MKSSIVTRPTPLRDQVFQVIVNELKSGEFSPGERITEEGLAKRLGVSRTPIREALGQLTRQGMLEARVGGGYVVPTPTVEEIQQNIAVRKLLEPEAVRMAAAEYGRAQIEAISKAVEAESRCASRPSPEQFIKANEQFRNAIFEHISNRVLSSLIAEFSTHAHFMRGATLHSVDLRGELVARHKKIRDALHKRDGDAAGALWLSMLELAQQTVAKTMTNAGRQPRSRPAMKTDAA